MNIISIVALDVLFYFQIVLLDCLICCIWPDKIDKFYIDFGSIWKFRGSDLIFLLQMVVKVSVKGYTK